ncbi:MAG: helix-hairpin-helix domain-containing protein, partial [Deltaproteobacteria bacterium]|nr:helix-hairpin-helix domain-containing protein [Candidatus Zymogenaceae bacterium]
TILEGEGALDRRLFEFKEQFEALIADLPRMSETGEAPAPGVPAAEEESAIRRFTQIPGVGEERARILFRAGFTSLSALAEASVARLFRIEGISLSLARDIADYLNPERFIDMEIMPPSRPKVKVEPEPSPPSFPISDPETAAELEAEIEAFFSDPLNHEPFSGAVKKKKESRLDDDPELLIMFIERFRTYMAHIGRLVDSMGQTPPVPVHVEELIDVSRSLAAVSRYMGFSDIGEEAGRVSEAAGGLGQGSDDRQDALFDIIRTAHTRLISELEKFKRSAEVQGAGKTDPKMEILNMLMSRWGELDELYSQVGRIIERASTVGVLDEETRRILKGKTIEIDTVASSLSELLDKEK